MKQSLWLRPDSQLLAECLAHSFNFLLLHAWEERGSAGAECSLNATAGPHSGAPAASIVQAGEAGPGILSFPENLCAGQKEPLSPGLPRLLPRPVAQVSRAVPISQPAFSLCLREHRGLVSALFPDTAPAPFRLWTLATAFLK